MDHGFDVKTTIELNDTLLQAAKDVAAREGTTLRGVFEAALRAASHLPFSKIGPLLVDADALLDELNIKKCVMVGNSFGGFLSWDQAQRHPERVRGLVISDAVGYQQSLPIYIRLFTFKAIAWLTRYTIPAFLLRMAVRDVYGDKAKIKKEIMNRYLELFMHKPNRSAVGQMVGVFTDGEFGSERLPQIQCKTLIVWGGDDRWVSIEMAGRFNRDIPNSELKVYREVGHIPMEEVPERFAADCIEFIEKL